MAQHMIRDIQTLLSRMEVSGQGWLGSVCLFILPYPSGGEGMTGLVVKASGGEGMVVKA